MLWGKILEILNFLIVLASFFYLFESPISRANKLDQSVVSEIDK